MPFLLETNGTLPFKQSRAPGHVHKTRSQLKNMDSTMLMEGGY
jgi:hypothetical protein